MESFVQHWTIHLDHPRNACRLRNIQIEGAFHGTPISPSIKEIIRHWERNFYQVLPAYTVILPIACPNHQKVALYSRQMRVPSCFMGRNYSGRSGVEGVLHNEEVDRLLRDVILALPSLRELLLGCWKDLSEETGLDAKDWGPNAAKWVGVVNRRNFEGKETEESNNSNIAEDAERTHIYDNFTFETFPDPGSSRRRTPFV